MIRTFCDCCTAEITEANEINSQDRPGRIRHESRAHHRPAILFEIIHGTGTTWNGGDLCKYCLIDAINTLDDRPRLRHEPSGTDQSNRVE